MIKENRKQEKLLKRKTFTQILDQCLASILLISFDRRNWGLVSGSNMLMGTQRSWQSWFKTSSLSTAEFSLQSSFCSQTLKEIFSRPQNVLMIKWSYPFFFVIVHLLEVRPPWWKTNSIQFCINGWTRSWWIPEAGKNREELEGINTVEL